MIANQPECVECKGACCLPERLEIEVPRPSLPFGLFASSSLAGLRHPIQYWIDELATLGFSARDGDCSPSMSARVNDHGRYVVKVRCFRHLSNDCPEETRPELCKAFPLNYLDDDHTDAERAEVREFCALFRRLEGA